MENKEIKMLLVLAGNYYQYKLYLKDLLRDTGLKTTNKIKYIDGEESIRGLRDKHFIEIGTCYERKDYNNILRLLKMQNIEEIQSYIDKGE